MYNCTCPNITTRDGAYLASSEYLMICHTFSLIFDYLRLEDRTELEKAVLRASIISSSQQDVRVKIIYLFLYGGERMKADSHSLM